MKMRRYIYLIISALFSITFFANFCFKNETKCDKKSEKIEFKTGDIIFQTSMSNQSKAIQIATNSIYSHCGIIIIENKKLFVVEAIQPVTKTSLNNFINRRVNKRYVVKRLNNADKIFTESVINNFNKEINKSLGKNYDTLFNWSDEKLYCSELVWKLYKNTTGIEIGKLGKLRDFNLENESVKKILKNRYSNKIPLNETVISPGTIFNFDGLTEVYSIK